MRRRQGHGWIVTQVCTASIVVHGVASHQIHECSGPVGYPERSHAVAVPGFFVVAQPDLSSFEASRHTAEKRVLWNGRQFVLVEIGAFGVSGSTTSFASRHCHPVIPSVTHDSVPVEEPQ